MPLVFSGCFKLYPLARIASKKLRFDGIELRWASPAEMELFTGLTRVDRLGLAMRDGFNRFTWSYFTFSLRH